MDETTVDGSAVLKIDLALGGLPFTRLGLVILKHLCRQKAEVPLLPSLVGKGTQEGYKL